MALAELLAGLERDAAVEIRAIDEAAAAEVARLDAEATRARNARRAAFDGELAAQRDTAADAELAEARRAARADVLAGRAAMLGRVRAEVEAALPALVADEATRLGPALVSAALACRGENAGKARCAPGLAGALLDAAPVLRLEVDPAVTGIVIALASGTLIEATLAALLEREWPRLAAEAAAELALREERAP